MADQWMIENLGEKFRGWAETLSDEEQRALAEWWERTGGDVSAHGSDDWWREDGAWGRRWSASWSSS